MCRIFLLWLLIINLIGLYCCFTIDPIKLELLDSKFRLSIANDPDIKWVAFNVNINKEFGSFESGQLSGLTSMPQNQLWSYEFNRNLQDSDIVYVWVAVQHNRLVFRDMKDPISVEAFKSGNSNYYVKTSSTSTTTETPFGPTIPNKLPFAHGGENKVCYPTITQLQKAGHFCKGDLIFEDKFDSFNNDHWTNEVRIPLDDDFEFVVYNGTVVVEDGFLKIDASLNGLNIRRDHIDFGARCTSFHSTYCTLSATNHLYVPPITSGRINSKKFFNFKYGRIEVRAKLPKGDWLFPLISLESSSQLYGDMYKSGEMRIAFVRGNHVFNWQNKNIGGDRLFGGAIFTTNETSRHLFMSDVPLSQISKSQKHFGDNFHIYSLTWTPDHLIMAVDSYEYGRINANFRTVIDDAGWNKGEHNAPLDQMFYITLGLSAGGHGDFPDGIKPWKNTDPPALLKFYKQRGTWFPTWSQPRLEIDFVRVYAI